MEDRRPAPRTCAATSFNYLDGSQAFLQRLSAWGKSCSVAAGESSYVGCMANSCWRTGSDGRWWSPGIRKTQPAVISKGDHRLINAICSRKSSPSHYSARQAALREVRLCSDRWKQCPFQFLLFSINSRTLHPGAKFEERERKCRWPSVGACRLVCGARRFSRAFVWAANWQSAWHISIQMVTIVSQIINYLWSCGGTMLHGETHVFELKWYKWNTGSVSNMVAGGKYTNVTRFNECTDFQSAIRDLCSFFIYQIRVYFTKQSRKKWALIFRSSKRQYGAGVFVYLFVCRCYCAKAAYLRDLRVRQLIPKLKFRSACWIFPLSKAKNPGKRCWTGLKPSAGPREHHKSWWVNKPTLFVLE